MSSETFVTHVSAKNNIILPAVMGNDSIYFGDISTFEELSILGVDEDHLISFIQDITRAANPSERLHSRSATVLKLGGNVIKLSGTGDPLVEAIVMDGIREGLNKTKTEDNDDVKIPRLVGGAKVGNTSLLISEFIPDYLPVPNFGQDAVNEFSVLDRKLVRVQRYFDAMQYVGLLDNMDVERWDDTTVIHFFDEALTNTLWPSEFMFDPEYPVLPNDYYRIDFDTVKIPRHDIEIN